MYMQAITLTIPPNLNVFSDDELYAFCLANPELRIERDETGHIIITLTVQDVLTY
ncbi:hypothetical protein GCM10028825_43400 [Spirosoma agri]|uniref:hypothetical protein n=1 Tax=Spirosoma agri TaxID=1987381 RepID=UPI001FEC527A|nr:hypothetical protein [Spirosoma agri]